MFDRLFVARDGPVIASQEDCAAFTPEELLHSITGSPEIAAALLAHFGSLPDLRDAGLADLEQVPGIGRRRARQLLAAFELSRRAAVPRALDGPTFRQASDAVQILLPVLPPLKREVFVVLLLSTRHRLLKIHTVSVGSVNASLVHPREVFRPAIHVAAASVILAHNHPSGDVSPSDDDVELTNRLVDAGRLLGIEVLDHVIVGGTGAHLSFRERGLLL